MKLSNVCWKIYCHKRKNLKVLYSPVNLSKHNIYAFFGRLKQFFHCIYHFIFNAPFCNLVEQPIHTFSKQVKYCLFLHCFDMFVEVTKEIIYRKWNTALLVDLIWACGQHVLFHNIFVCFCLHCACAQIIITLIFSLSIDLQYFRFQILVSIPSIINPNIKHSFFFIPYLVGMSL